MNKTVMGNPCLVCGGDMYWEDAGFWLDNMQGFHPYCEGKAKTGEFKKDDNGRYYWTPRST